MTSKPRGKQAKQESPCPTCGGKGYRIGYNEDNDPTEFGCIVCMGSGKDPMAQHTPNVEQEVSQVGNQNVDIRSHPSSSPNPASLATPPAERYVREALKIYYDPAPGPKADEWLTQTTERVMRGTWIESRQIKRVAARLEADAQRIATARREAVLEVRKAIDDCEEMELEDARQCSAEGLKDEEVEAMKRVRVYSKLQTFLNSKFGWRKTFYNEPAATPNPGDTDQ